MLDGPITEGESLFLPDGANPNRWVRLWVVSVRPHATYYLSAPGNPFFAVAFGESYLRQYAVRGAADNAPV